ncbi:MAG: hypothetical protein ABI222_05865 [Opitutaceae bacterium]
MKTKFLPLSLSLAAAGVFALGASAQVATPSSPAPAVDVAAVPQASQVVYSPRLPSASELMNVASAQGLTIDKMVQTAGQMTVVYRSANGQTNTVAYLLLPSAGSTAIAPVVSSDAVSAVSTAVVGTTTPTMVVVQQPATTTRVVYSPAPVYYDPFFYPAYYNPWYAPVSVNVGWGFGYYGGYRGGYNRGGYHGGGYHGGGGHGRR